MENPNKHLGQPNTFYLLPYRLKWQCAELLHDSFYENNLIYDQISWLKIWLKSNFVLFFITHFKHYIWLTSCSNSDPRKHPLDYPLCPAASLSADSQSQIYSPVHLLGCTQATPSACTSLPCTYFNPLQWGEFYVKGEFMVPYGHIMRSHLGWAHRRLLR